MTQLSACALLKGGMIVSNHITDFTEIHLPTVRKLRKKVGYKNNVQKLTTIFLFTNKLLRNTMEENIPFKWQQTT